jgi:hypothetical protein
MRFGSSWFQLWFQFAITCNSLIYYPWFQWFQCLQFIRAYMCARACERVSNSTGTLEPLEPTHIFQSISESPQTGTKSKGVKV